MPDPSEPIRPIIAAAIWTNTETIYASIIFVLLVIAAVTTSSESAFFSLNPQEKDKLKSENSKSSRIILDLLSKPRELIALLLISINFVNVGIVILSTLILNKMMDGYSEVEKLLVEIFGITLLILITGEVIPKIYGANNASSVTRIMALPIEFLRKTPPISWLKNLLVNGTSFIGKIGGKSVRISTDELEQAIAISTEVSVSEDEQKLLEGIVKLGKTEAVQIMTPRIEMATIADYITFSEVLNVVLTAGYSRIPIHKNGTDNVVGILYIKDLLPHINKADFNWQALIRKPFFIPENKKIDDLLQEFRAMKMHMAVVVDEYGGASGIVTLEDVLEEIVGDITDEFDDASVEYKKLEDGTLAFEGRTSLIDFYKILEIEGEEFEEIKGDAETIGGFIVEQSGRILKNKESIVNGRYKLTVISSDKRRIKWVKIQEQ